MKKMLLGMLVIAAITSTSCKKDKDDPSCEKSVAGIAGNYKLTKVIAQVSGTPDTEVTNSVTTDCERNGVYQLKTDKTVTYTESGSCSDSGSGTWDVVDNKITISTTGGSFDFSSQDIDSWDCTTLVIKEGTAVGSYKISLTKQ